MCDVTCFNASHVVVHAPFMLTQADWQLILAGGNTEALKVAAQLQCTNLHLDWK